MTDKEAIETIEFARAFNEKHTQLMIALDMACDAIQEHIDRERGCEFCQDNFDFWASEISGYFDRKDIKFCLHCGRKLKTAMPGGGRTT